MESILSSGEVTLSLFQSFFAHAPNSIYAEYDAGSVRFRTETAGFAVRATTYGTA